MRSNVFCRLFLLALGVLILPQAAHSQTGHRYALFDGITLHGWTAENGAVAIVEDGNVLLKAGDGWLRSDHTYGDFRLHIEWKALKADGYDAGIFLRASREGKPFPKP